MSSAPRSRSCSQAGAAAAIDHPNVYPVYEINVKRDRPFIAMAFLEGRTVADRLASGPMAVQEAVEVAIQTARGLEAAHDKGIIHRDVKPSNLMLRRPRDRPAARGAGRQQPSRSWSRAERSPTGR